MIYKVIGLMSGSSLDGLDIAYVHLEETRGKWSFVLHHAECISYTEQLSAILRTASQKPVAEFLKLHTSYGHYLGNEISSFIKKYQLEHKIDFIASHGHTVFHEPENKTTFQLGDGAAIAAAISLPVISDLRNMDTALGGQGAPIVPIGDKLLFDEYDYLLNIGGIANLTVKDGEEIFAFDICPANQVLNVLAGKMNLDYDDEGKVAASGNLLTDALGDLNAQEYYQQSPPKSLSNEAATVMIFPALLSSAHSVPDMLHTMVEHIAEQIAYATKKFSLQKDTVKMLVTGGGAFNQYLVSKIIHAVATQNISVVVPDEATIKYKEALVMALIGTLRWREEINVLSSVTGASRDSVGGALWQV